jgi:hypothetical protein
MRGVRESITGGGIVSASSGGGTYAEGGSVNAAGDGNCGGLKKTGGLIS